MLVVCMCFIIFVVTINHKFQIYGSRLVLLNIVYNSVSSHHAAPLRQAGGSDRSALSTGMPRSVSSDPSISALDCHGTGHYWQ